MRVILLICVLFVVNGWSLPVDDSVPVQTEIIEQPEINNEEALLEIDSQQGHENESGRQARQFGFGGIGIGFTGGFGGIGHGYGGYGGGYPVYGGGYGGYPYYGGYGGYGHHHHHRGGFGYYG